MTRTPLLAGLVFLSLCVSFSSNAAKETAEASPASKGTKIPPGSESKSNKGADLEVKPLFREIEKKFQERGAQAAKRLDALLPILKDTKHPDHKKIYCEALKEAMYYAPTLKISGGNPLVVSQEKVFAVDFLVQGKNRSAFVLAYGYESQGVHLLVKLVDMKQAFIELGDANPKGQEIYAYALGCKFTFIQGDPFALTSEPH